MAEASARAAAPLPLDWLAERLGCEAAEESFTAGSVSEAYDWVVARRFTGLVCIGRGAELLTVYVADGVALGAHFEGLRGSVSGMEALDAAEREVAGPVEVQAVPLPARSLPV